ncbi:MAG: SPASM domain-containing protein [Candidatus Mcinerneyibacterium aminivorans]|uniref:SPASM domain-containing protein n=1 Tax=Candidatus Mcinerneyibacterium aminivorans TaxID=2703815 RepID=A0A5D0MGK6_9BACT|nr:MAG: SPASM domain-containing protein [Candidatus Mcinerneyibacterium aminivorans]
MFMKWSKYNLYFDIDEYYLGIFNSLYKSLSLYKKPNMVNFKRKIPFDIKEFSKDLIYKMQQKGFVLEKDINEEGLVKRKYYLKNNQDFIPGICIYLTYDCNFDCVYCYEKNQNGKNNYNYNDKKFKISNLIEFVKRNIEENKPYSIMFFGGEPLLEKEKLLNITEKINDEVKKKNSKLLVSITTNGFLLDKKFINKIKKFKIRNIQITIDGNKKRHNARRPLKSGEGSFSQIVKNLKYAVGVLSKKSISVRVNVDDSNKSSVGILYKKLEELDIIDKIIFTYGRVWVSSNNRKKLKDRLGNEIIEIEGKEYRNIVSKLPSELSLKSNHMSNSHLNKAIMNKLAYRPCIVRNNNFYVVDLNGDIYKCFIDAGNEKKKIGKVSKGINEKNKTFLKFVSYEPWKYKPCNNCEILPMCYGGCPNGRIFEDKNLKGKCSGTKITVRNKIKEIINDEYKKITK